MAGFSRLLSTLLRLALDAASLLGSLLRPRASLAAENLFLRKQLALFQERKVRPRRADGVTRLGLVLLSRFFDWKDALVVVKPGTLIHWHKQGFRIFWRWKVGRGRPPLPPNLRELIRAMARDNPSWGEERIAAELSLKLGTRVSARTVRKHMPRSTGPGSPGRAGIDRERWGSFVRNHASPDYS
ncbi:MAG: hypothetical protein A2V83_00805 [Nitrospirae bacterium RBG_16_64_22]|nr:MAG: hypothetical protein A2V83_00805 [Nitrospirae bacterium RBG_16_64_22]